MILQEKKIKILLEIDKCITIVTQIHPILTCINLV